MNAQQHHQYQKDSQNVKIKNQQENSPVKQLSIQEDFNQNQYEKQKRSQTQNQNQNQNQNQKMNNNNKQYISHQSFEEISQKKIKRKAEEQILSKDEKINSEPSFNLIIQRKKQNSKQEQYELSQNPHSNNKIVLNYQQQLKPISSQIIKIKQKQNQNNYNQLFKTISNNNLTDDLQSQTSNKFIAQEIQRAKKIFDYNYNPNQGNHYQNNNIQKTNNNNKQVRKTQKLYMDGDIQVNLSSQNQKSYQNYGKKNQNEMFQDNNQIYKNNKYKVDQIPVIVKKVQHYNHNQDYQSMEIKVTQTMALSSPQKFMEKPYTHTFSAIPNQDQFKTGQFGIKNSNRNSPNLKNNINDQINNKDKNTHLHQLFRNSLTNNNNNSQIQQSPNFMDQKQFMNLKNKFGKQQTGQDIDQIQKKSDDSHNKSAIDLINEAFGGNNSNIQNSPNPFKQRKYSLTQSQNFYNKNQSHFISNNNYKGIFGNNQFDANLNNILNQKVFDVNYMTKKNNGSSKAIQLNNLGDNQKDKVYMSHIATSEKQRQSQKPTFLDLLAMQNNESSQNKQQQKFKSISSNNNNKNFNPYQRKASQDMTNTKNIGYTQQQQNHNEFMQVFLNSNNSNMKKVNYQNKSQYANLFMSGADFKKTQSVLNAQTKINPPLTHNNTRTKQPTKQNLPKSSIDDTIINQLRNKSKSTIQKQYQKETNNLMNKKYSIVTNPPVIDLKLNQINLNFNDQQQARLSKSIIVKNSSQSQNIIDLNNDGVRQNNQSQVMNANQSRISHVSNKNKSQLGVSSISVANNPYRSQGPITFSQPFQQFVPCNQSKTMHQYQKDKFFQKKSIIEVKMDKHQIIHKSFFMPNYVMYHIKVLYQDIHKKSSQKIPDMLDINLDIDLGQNKINQNLSNQTIIKDLTVKRNYQDFQRFRSILQKHYPGFHLPYLQSNSWISQTNIDFVRKQKAMLQFFLNDLIKNPYIKNSHLLHDFITTEDHKSFKRKIQQYQKGRIVPPIKSIEEFILPQNQIIVKLTQQQKIFSDHFTPYLENMSINFQKLNQLFENVTSSLQSVSIYMNSISQLLKSMGKKTRNFNTRVSTSGCHYAITQDLAKLLEKMSQSYKVQGQTMKDRKTLILKDFVPLLKYQASNVTSFKKLINKRNQFTQAYLKRINEQAKQLKTYPSHNVNVYLGERCQHGKNGLLLQQSRDILVCKYQTAFLNTQVCTQGQRLFGQTSQKIKKVWQDLLKMQLDMKNQQKNKIDKILMKQKSTISNEISFEQAKNQDV